MAVVSALPHAAANNMNVPTTARKVAIFLMSMAALLCAASPPLIISTANIDGGYADFVPKEWPRLMAAPQFTNETSG